MRTHIALRVGVLSMLAREPTSPRDLGRRRLVTRGEIKRVAAPGQSGRLAKLLDTRVRSAFEGRVLLAEQPAEYRTGLSAADEQALIDCVERHFSFAPLDQTAEIALAIEVDQVGVALEQGLGVRNQLYRARHERFRGGLPRDILPTSWDQLPQDCTNADRLAHAPAVPPLVVLRSMLAARHKLSPKLCANLVEAVVEAHSRPNQEASFRNALLRGGRLAKLQANQQKTLRAVVLKLPASFWPAAAWACANDVQGSQPKHASQRRSRAAERLFLRQLRQSGVVARSEAELQSRTSTPDIIVDAGPLYALGIQWVDLKHAFGRGNASRYVAQVAKYCEDWGPGALVFTLGYTEALADELRATGPVWVLDTPTGKRMLSDAAAGRTRLPSDTPAPRV